MLSEQELVKQCINRQNSALEELYKRYSPLMYGVCLRYVRNRDDAMDLLHDGFIKVFSSIEGFRFTGSLEGWIRRIMVHTAINFYNRQMSRRDNSYETVSETLRNDEPDAISEMSAEELLDHIQALPDGYRVVFNLYAIEGYQHEEIAQILGISESTSKTQLMKARRMLMTRIKNKVYETI
jgi:RNA polymerase sigma factor (sigma-70 family)